MYFNALKLFIVLLYYAFILELLSTYLVETPTVIAR